MKNLLRKVVSKDNETKSKRKIENIVFLVIILIITLIIMKTIWKEENVKKDDIKLTNTTSGKILADSTEENPSKLELESKLENILSTMKNVGKVNVLINYSESSSLIPLYNESTTTSSTEEGDTSGGTRNVTETEIKKDVVFSEKSGSKEPVTQKTMMPTIQGAIITAQGAADANVKTNIINAVVAVTGLSMDKIQVFEIEN